MRNGGGGTVWGLIEEIHRGVWDQRVWKPHDVFLGNFQVIQEGPTLFVTWLCFPTVRARMRNKEDAVGKD